MANQATPWYNAVLEWSLKHYAIYNHAYTVVNALGQIRKQGIFCIAGGQNPYNPIAVIETANEVPPVSVGGPPRPGFPGQYGKAEAVSYTGTQYEFAFAFETNPARGVATPLGLSLYGDGGAAGTTDALHVMFVPTGTTYRKAGVNYAGPKILVLSGVFDTVAGPNTMVVRGVITPTIALVPQTEYFVRIQYWPDRSIWKGYDSDSTSAPNLDRRLRVFLSTERTAKVYQGEVSLVDVNYTVPRNYCYLFCVNEWYNDQGWIPYDQTKCQFDEVVVGSEWLPFDDMRVSLQHSWSVGYAAVTYFREDDDLTHSAASVAKGLRPTFRPFDQLEVFVEVEKRNHTLTRLYESDFQNPFPDGWTLTAVTGAWQQETTPIVKFTDEFDEVYTNKGNDSRWHVWAGTWNTSTNLGELTGTGANAWLGTSGASYTVGDFVIETTLRVDNTGGAEQIMIIAGCNGAIVNNGRVYGRWEEAKGWVIAEYNGGFFVYRSAFNNTLSPLGTERVVKIIRVGALVKLYIDGSLLCVGEMPFANSVTGDVSIYGPTNTTYRVGYIRVRSPFPDSYSYMSNTGLSTAVNGQIDRTIVTSQITGYAVLEAWERMGEKDPAVWSDIYLKMHYDGVIANPNWMGLGIQWDGAQQKGILRLHDTDAHFVEMNFPTDIEVSNEGYRHHKYMVRWTVTAGNITEVWLVDVHTGLVLGTLAGLANAYSSPNLVVELENWQADNEEIPYIGYFSLFEEPPPTNVWLEDTLFHGEVRREPAIDEAGNLLVEAYPITLRLDEMPEDYDLPGTHPTEIKVTDGDIYKSFLLEDGRVGNRWFHYWNYTQTANTWTFIRMRGASAKDVFSYAQRLNGNRWMVTPEQQWIVAHYFRDFRTVDILHTGDPLPQGIFFTNTRFEDTQENFIQVVRRIDDAMPGKWTEKVKVVPASGVDPFVAGNQVWTGAAHAAPTPVGWPEATVNGNISTPGNVGGYASAQVYPTLGLNGTNPAADVALFGAQVQSTNSHKNQGLEVTLLATKPWYRPMDIVEVVLDWYDPTTEEVTTIPAGKHHVYVVHSVEHNCKAGTIVYLLGRMEIQQAEGFPVVVDGYGESTTKHSMDSERSLKIRNTQANTVR